MEASTIDQVLAKSVDKNAVIVTDGHASHSHIKENFASHIPVVEYNPEKVAKNNLPWVHIVIGECRNGIAAIHKEIDSRFLQLYLKSIAGSIIVESLGTHQTRSMTFSTDW